MRLQVTITQTIPMDGRKEGQIIARFQMHDSDVAQRRALAERIRAAHRAGQSVLTSPCYRWRKDK